MRAILSLFGRSPFAPLQNHMDSVSSCVKQLEKLFEALESGNHQAIEDLATKTSKLEHDADIIKQGIRNNLPNNMILPVDRGALLEILTLQDNIADVSEDVAVLLTLRTLTLPPEFKKDFAAFLQKNIETFEKVQKIIQELDHLLQSSFGGAEAEKVRTMVKSVAYSEHETDLLQRRLLKELFRVGDDMSAPIFHLWLRIFEETGEVSNLSEKLAYRVRTMLNI